MRVQRCADSRPGSHNLCIVGTNHVYYQHIFELSPISQTDEESQRFSRNPSRLWLPAGDVDGFDFLAEGATLPASVSKQSQSSPRQLADIEGSNT